MSIDNVFSWRSNFCCHSTDFTNIMLTMHKNNREFISYKQRHLTILDKRIIKFLVMTCIVKTQCVVLRDLTEVLFGGNIIEVSITNSYLSSKCLMKLRVVRTSKWLVKQKAVRMREYEKNDDKYRSNIHPHGLSWVCHVCLEMNVQKMIRKIQEYCFSYHTGVTKFQWELELFQKKTPFKHFRLHRLRHIFLAN